LTRLHTTPCVALDLGLGSHNLSVRASVVVVVPTVAPLVATIVMIENADPCRVSHSVV
jgi:hypothetical protein